MTITLNNETKELSQEAISITELITQFAIKAERGVAIAVNEMVVPNTQWAKHQVKDQDKILIITATQGG